MAKYSYLLNQKFISKYNEEFIVVGEEHDKEQRDYKYIIKFTSTEYQVRTRPVNILEGRVKDWSKCSESICINMFKSDKSYMSNSGYEFVVISGPFKRKDKRTNHKYVTVKFLETGTIKDFRVDNVSKMAVDDPFYPSVAGVGYCGDIMIRHSDKFGRRIYQCWRNMIKRCYDETRHDYDRYGGNGTTVSKEWHCFKTFYYDVQQLDGFDKDKVLNSELQLDKDKKTFDSNSREYSKDNCQWLTPEENYKYRRPRRERANI